jgi:hypothetical protein
MHKTRYSLTIILLLACALLWVAGCRDTGLDPIFYTLENEEPIVDRGLSNEITVSQVVTAGTDYYAAAGKVYTRAAAGGDWTAVASPADSLCATLAYLTADDALYAGFTDRSDGSGLGLWKLELSGGDWTQLSDFSTSAEVTMLKVAGPQLFVSTLESQVGKLYYYDLAGSFQGGSALPFSDDHVFVRDIAYDTADYWLTAGPYLCTSADPGAGFAFAAGLDAISLPDDHGDPRTVSELRGLHYAAGGAGNLPAGLYVSVYEYNKYKGKSYGLIAHYNLSDTWKFSGEVSTTFTEFLAADTDRLWVGALGQGYYDLTSTDVATLFTNFERYDDNTNADLYNGAILRFAKNGTTIFACSSLAGLWATGNLGESWSRE